jgi:hypothetical protein
VNRKKCTHTFDGKKVQRWTDECYSVLQVLQHSRRQNSTQSSVRQPRHGVKVLQRFSDLTPSPSWGCCWRLGKTKTDKQVPYCAVCRPGRPHRKAPVCQFLCYRALNMETQSVPETLDNFHRFSRLSARDFIVNVTYSRWPHLPSKGNRWPLSEDSTVYIERLVGTGQTCKTKQMTVA